MRVVRIALLLLLDLVLMPIRFVVYVIALAADWADHWLREQLFWQVKAYERLGFERW